MDILDNIERCRNKQGYIFIEAILQLLDTNIKLFDKNDKFNMIKIFKKRMAADLIDNNLYKDFEYKLKIKKNYIYTVFTENKNNIDQIIKQYISLYLHLNILILNENRYYFIYKYNPKIGTILFILDNNKYLPVEVNNKVFYNNTDIQLVEETLYVDELYRYKDESDISNSEKKLLKHLKNCKLSELNLYAVKYNIDTHTYNDNNVYKQKTKQELYEDIKNTIIN